MRRVAAAAEEEIGAEPVQWVDRLQEAVGWQEGPWECDWAETESELGTALPSDYKAMYERFGPGYFSLVLWLLGDRGRHHSVIGWWHSFQASYTRRRAAGQPSDTFKPYQIYLPGQGKGVIPWGWSQTEGRFYWLAESDTDPDSWPVVCTSGEGREWYSAAVSASEFVYRMLADPAFAPYSVAEFVNPPTFHRPYRTSLMSSRVAALPGRMASAELSRRQPAFTRLPSERLPSERLHSDQLP